MPRAKRCARGLAATQNGRGAEPQHAAASCIMAMSLRVRCAVLSGGSDFDSRLHRRVWGVVAASMLIS